MKEIIRFWLLNRVIKNTTLTAEIYQMLYNHRTFVRPVEFNTFNEVYLEPSELSLDATPFTSSTTTPSISNRKRELTSALVELKSKPFKSKQDKDSIGILEAALKNVN